MNNITFSKQLEIFISIIILGYFGIKIVYGFFFNFYPEKYYYRNIDVSTNQNKASLLTQNITLNAYVPGMWNNEMTDFISLLVLIGVVYVYTNASNKSFINNDGNLNFGFLFGYILGLGYPVFYTYYGNIISKEVQTSTMIKIIYYIILLAFIMFIVIMNYNAISKLGDISSVHRLNYNVYVIVIVLLFFGLLLSKKNSKNYNSVTYFYNNGQQCTFAQNGVLQTSGDTVHITIPFLVFILLLLFSYEPSELSMKNLYIFVYGMLLGILVSGISYYGIEYFLEKKPEKECKDINECTLKEMPLPATTPIVPTTAPAPLSTDNMNYKINKFGNTASTIKMIIIIILILIAIYLIYYYIKNRK